MIFCAMPAMIEGSPWPRCCSLPLNQFQHRYELAEAGWAG